ncbi:MAG: FAS1-like dehydratase domain-containing protein [Tepidiformaceae bacterium]
MPEASLLTDDVRALIGRASPPVAMVISRAAVAQAIELFHGMDHGKERPPLPGEGERAPGYVLGALEPEPNRMELPALMPNSLLIGNEWQFERPLRVGEELSLVTRIADVSERFGGRFGYSLTFRSEVEFRDGAGQVVAKSVRTMMQYDARDARDGGEEP